MKLAPLIPIVTAFIACAAFVGVALLFVPMTGTDKLLLYWYQMPVGFVFVLFVIDRWNERFVRSRWQWLIDVVTLLVSASRTITWFLPLSGHTVFLSYAITTGKDYLMRGTALLVLIEAIVIKHFWLTDDFTPWTGLAVGLLAAGLTRLQKHIQLRLNNRS